MITVAPAVIQVLSMILTILLMTLLLKGITLYVEWISK